MGSPKNEKGWYGIKKPRGKGKGGRAQFAIELHVKVEGKEKTSHVKLPELDKVNQLYLADTISFEDALKHVESLKKKLYEERDKDLPKLFFSTVNKKVLKGYLDAKYRLKAQRMEDFDSMKADLTRAVGACGPVSLVTGTHDDIQNKIDEDYATESNKQRRIATRLNSILKWLGRDFQLVKFPEEFEEVRYLTLDEFNLAIKQVKDPVEVLLWKVAFGTGLRCGEIFGLKPGTRQGNKLRVLCQMDEEFKIRKTKTRRVRTSWILNDFIAAVDEWVALSIETKQEYRKKNHARSVKRVCSKVFKGNDFKRCVFHDLRHSYAIYLYGQGVPNKQVAEALGNSERVCEKYYGGYQLTNYGIDLIGRLLSETK